MYSIYCNRHYSNVTSICPKLNKKSSPNCCFYSNFRVQIIRMPLIYRPAMIPEFEKSVSGERLSCHCFSCNGSTMGGYTLFSRLWHRNNLHDGRKLGIRSIKSEIFNQSYSNWQTTKYKLLITTENCSIAPSLLIKFLNQGYSSSLYRNRFHKINMIHIVWAI